MPHESTGFEEFDAQIRERGTTAGLEYLRGRFLESKEYHKLFEVLKMQARLDSGLPLLYEDQLDRLDPIQQKQFEDRLLEACETVGELFFQAGEAATGWMYLQPVADGEKARQLLRGIEVGEDNLDEVVQVALAEGVDPEYGYDLVLKHYGTCNSITTYDSQITMQSADVKRAAAEALVAHLYRELVENVRNHVAEQEGKPAESENLMELIRERDWLFAGGGHHVDTTHLASVVRIARQVRDPDTIQMAVELAEYGMRLDEQFQFAGDEPFEEIYPDHLRYFKGKIGHQPEQVESWFLKKLAGMEPGMVRSITVESLIDFLFQTGQNQRAIEVCLREQNSEHQSMGIAPNLFSIAGEKDDFVRIADHFREDGDLLSYSIARLLDSEQSKKNTA